MGEMKIELLLDPKPVKKSSYKLAHRYTDIVKNEIDNMLKVGIIYLVDQSKWASPMVIQPKQHDPKKIRFCVDFKWFNRVTMTDPFPTPFTKNIVGLNLTW